jgi:hypothetical protein
MTRLVALLAAGLLLGGCSVETTERTYDAAFIRQIGTGSTTLASATHALESARFSAGLRDPKLQGPVQFLLEGRLDKLTERDLVAIAEANVKIGHQYGGTVAAVESAGLRLLAAKVKANSYKDLSNGAKRFVVVWNRYLVGLASGMELTVRTLEKESPRVNELQTVLRDAFRSRDRSTAATFNAARLRYLHALVRTGHTFEAVKAATAKEADFRPLSDLVKHNSEAEAIVRKVNERYPNGALAQQFKNG